MRLQLHALAYNLANFLRTLSFPEAVSHWSMTTLRNRLVKIGAKIVRHGRSITFQMGRAYGKCRALPFVTNLSLMPSLTAPHRASRKRVGVGLELRGCAGHRRFTGNAGPRTFPPGNVRIGRPPDRPRVGRAGRRNPVPVFLDENMMGRDDAVAGFPHLLLCMGFVARTNNDLWGVHLASPNSSQETFLAFWQWARGKGLAKAAITEIYGCCNRAIRYGRSNPAGAWAEEMQWFANALGVWHGVAYGFDTGILAPTDGTYVEYRWQLAAMCRIFYKLNEQTAPTGPSQMMRDDPNSDVRVFRGVVNRAITYNHYVHRRPGIAVINGALDEVNYAQRLSQVPV